MRIHIQKHSEISIRKQLSEQIVFLIATGKLKARDALPSVREMALRHARNSLALHSAARR